MKIWFHKHTVEGRLPLLDEWYRKHLAEITSPQRWEKTFADSAEEPR